MSYATSICPSHELQKGLDLLGLNLSDQELQEFQVGLLVSLEDRGIGEIGSVLILAAALAKRAGHPFKTIPFRDLPKAAAETSACRGIPIHCWQEEQTKRCIYLTFVDGKPAIQMH